MYKPKIEQLKTAFQKSGYKLNTRTWELNLIGIRCNKGQSNTFDDTLCVLFKDEYGDDTLICFSCTTDPSLFWLLHPMNAEGCLILKQGQYPNAYKLGVHKGYKALEQISAMHYYRDNNKDNELDINASSKAVTGIFKTNIHHASFPNETSAQLDKWSAGCQVINKGWLEFLELIDQSILVTGKKVFDYTLFNVDDLND